MNTKEAIRRLKRAGFVVEQVSEHKLGVFDPAQPESPPLALLNAQTGSRNAGYLPHPLMVTIQRLLGGTPHSHGSGQAARGKHPGRRRR